MSKVRAGSSTKAEFSLCLSPAEAKARVQASGLTLKQWAQERQLSYRTVSEVVRGVNKGLFGEGHRAAVALGIKRG